MLSALNDLPAGQGPWVVGVSLLALLAMEGSLPAGTLAVPYRCFIGWAMTGAAVWVTVYLVIGSVAGSAARQHQDLLVPLIAAVAVLVGGMALVIKRLTASRLTRPRRRPLLRDHGPQTPDERAKRPLARTMDSGESCRSARFSTCCRAAVRGVRTPRGPDRLPSRHRRNSPRAPVTPDCP
ncbi:DedA family protein [Planobispora takensis]|uniref:Uncharacterized protein n=1 Tax=Planobispora takensis TaxID=1367882 RepID=A0A8J3T4N0_9ACTN|nr:hypothetical protein [Planobispora takensis]GII06002.1 hypothetical protein Pta02_80100 [Planobispora takensis]